MIKKGKIFSKFCVRVATFTHSSKKNSKIQFVYKNAKIINLRPSQSFYTFTDINRKQSSDQQKQKFAIYYSFTSLQWQQTIYQFAQNNAIIVLKCKSIIFNGAMAKFAFNNGITVVLWRWNGLVK